MRTITIDIIDDKAMRLLRELELLNLIHVHNESPKEITKSKWLRYKGVMSKQPLNKVEKQLTELRSEWE